VAFGCQVAGRVSALAHSGLEFADLARDEREEGSGRQLGDGQHRDRGGQVGSAGGGEHVEPAVYDEDRGRLGRRIGPPPCDGMRTAAST